MMRDERGNALFLILLGVVLFAALSLAVTNGFRANDSLSNTRIMALSDDILLTGAGLEKAVSKMLAKGISESRLSFTRSSGDGYELSPVSDPTEQVFNIAGGGAVYLDPPKDALDKNMSAQTNYGSWVFTGSNWVSAVGSGGTTPQLVAILPYVRQNVCVALNNRLGITNPSGIPPRSNGDTYVNTKFTGGFSNVGRIKAPGPTNYLNQKKTGCFEGETDDSSANITGRYYFYYVLEAR